MADINIGLTKQARGDFVKTININPQAIEVIGSSNSPRPSDEPIKYRFFTYIGETIMTARYMMMFRSAMLLGELAVQRVVIIQAIETAIQVEIWLQRWF
jgi:hypothetical protein